MKLSRGVIAGFILNELRGLAVVSFALFGHHAAHAQTTPPLVAGTSGYQNLKAGQTLGQGANPFGLMVGSFTSGHVLEAGAAANQIIDGGASPYTGCSGVTAGSYTSANITVTSAGCITLASNGSGGGGGMTLISKVVTSGSQTSVTFSSIPQTYTHLQLTVWGRSLNASFEDDLNIQFNGDTGANYARQYIVVQTTSVSAGSSGATTAIDGVSITAASALANAPGGDSILIQNYTSTVFIKTTYTNFHYNNSLSQMGLGIISGLWNSTAAITSIKLSTVSGSGLANGTVVALYGIP